MMGKNKTPEEALWQQLEQMQKEDPRSNIAVSHHPTTLEIENIFFQTGEMRASFESYPEVLIIDTTYKLTTNNMPLVVFDVIDCYGAGRIAGYCLISNEKKEIVTEALQLFVSSCPEIVGKIKTVLVDKDQSEIGSVKAVIPHAEVHLCDFHVKEAMKRGGNKCISNYDEIKPIVNKLIHAHTKEDYDEAYEELKNCKEKVKPEYAKSFPHLITVPEKPFLSYFNKNWHESDLVWSEFQRNVSFNLGERTTGRVESHNGKIKIIVSKQLPVPMLIQRLRALHKHNCSDNDYKAFLEATKVKYHKYSKDPIIQIIMKLNTPFVGDLLRRQYERSLQPPSHNQHDVSPEKCDCAFHVNYKLQCSHIFRERRIKGKVNN